MSLRPKDAVFPITYESTDPPVVTVSENGILTDISYGTAVITAQTYNGYTVMCVITVEK